MHRLESLVQKDKRRVIGLISGTSADGVDAALVEISGCGGTTAIVPIAYRNFPYPPALRTRVLALSSGSVREVCELNAILGDFFGRSAMGLLEEVGGPVDLIGSHGQTVYHIDRKGPGVPSTLQIGEPAVIAERTGAVVVGDFRQADVAAGGNGAPLVPYVDWLLFGRQGSCRALLNVGGIANVTVVSGQAQETIAFDTGPGNMIVDEVARAITGRPDAIDRDGVLSQQGRLDEGLLRELMAHPYIDQSPPKSTGREIFGREFAQGLIVRYGRPYQNDLLATLVAFTARSVADSFERFILPYRKVDELLVSGGGVKNRTLMRRLSDLLAPIPVREFSDRGVSALSKEAVTFAVLANETIHGLASNLPQVTGATRPVVLGKICL